MHWDTNEGDAPVHCCEEEAELKGTALDLFFYVTVLTCTVMRFGSGPIEPDPGSEQLKMLLLIKIGH